MPRPRNVANRALLAVAGAALFCAGAWALTGNSAVRERLPRGLPAMEPGPLLPGHGVLDGARTQGWWTPSVIAALSLVLLALVWWLLAQVWTRRPGVLPLPRPGVGLRAGALARAMAEQTERLPDVERGRVPISGRGRGGR
ncbi:alkaline shock response membrane anchor protein AmaP, partial [Streptomyces sp. NPDC059096]|uniref:alkaline shock response membrane anchor protein AmaP n=1 Tax=Streptomyces sp. NPDC059096 TaxID=3346727 RepID=UPI0036915057